MGKPGIFLGSSGKQKKLLDALTRGLEDIAEVHPWTTVFNPGTNTLDRLVELTRQVDFAAFIFARDDWTTAGAAGSTPGTGQGAPRDNVVFEAGLFGGVIGMHRTFILHANDAKLPSDLLGLTAVRYDDALTPAAMRGVNQKLRAAIENMGRVSRIEGWWWQHALTERGALDPSAVSLLRISRGRDGMLQISGRAWQEDGKLSSRYWCEATRERKDPAGIFYYANGERPRSQDAPRYEGIGEIRLESADRATGYYTVRTDGPTKMNTRTSGLYLRAAPEDVAVFDGNDDARRAELLAERLKQWKSIAAG